jgi:hypothetical protein
MFCDAITFPYPDVTLSPPFGPFSLLEVIFPTLLAVPDEV